MPQTSQEQNADRIRRAFDLNRRKMTVQLARELGVSEVEVIRCLPDGLAVELDASRWEQIVADSRRWAKSTSLSPMVR